MTESSLPISETTLARLRELARWSGLSIGEVLDQAIKDQYDRKFWEATNAGYAALRADPQAWAEVQAERKLWDATLMDGLDRDERWTDDGDVVAAGQAGNHFMSSAPSPQRGEVWLADLDPTFGHEQGGRRPVLVISVDPFNAGRSGLVVVLPITSRVRPLPLHVPIHPPEGGLRLPSAILCDAIRSIDEQRLLAYWGTVSPATIALVEGCLRHLLGL